MITSKRGSEGELLPAAAVCFLPLVNYPSSAHKSGKGEILITEENIAPIKEALSPMAELEPCEVDLESLEEDIISPEP